MALICCQKSEEILRALLKWVSLDVKTFAVNILKFKQKFRYDQSKRSFSKKSPIDILYCTVLTDCTKLWNNYETSWKNNTMNVSCIQTLFCFCLSLSKGSFRYLRQFLLMFSHYLQDKLCLFLGFSSQPIIFLHEGNTLL